MTELLFSVVNEQVLKTYFVDAFTNQKFKGNPAAVCIVEGVRAIN
jgi:predicted PhzF superfamily epimerase YddE/YHI9